MNTSVWSTNRLSQIMERSIQHSRLRQGDAEKKRKVRPRLSRPLRFIK